MDTHSTIEFTTYRNLADGDIFQGDSAANGAPFLGMKVATRDARDDQPNHDVLVFYQDRPPAVFPESYIGHKGVVGKYRNLAFSVDPRQPSDLILSVSADIRARAVAGCVYIVGNDVFLGAAWGQQAESICYVNVKTGECWHNATVGTSNVRRSPGLAEIDLLRGSACAVPSWQIVETVLDKTAPKIAYAITALQDNAAA